MWTHNLWIFSVRNRHILKFKIKSAKYYISLIWFRSLNIKIQCRGKACVQSLINLYWLLNWILSWTGVSLKAAAVSQNLGGNYCIHTCAYKKLSKCFFTAKPTAECVSETLFKVKSSIPAFVSQNKRDPELQQTVRIFSVRRPKIKLINVWYSGA